MADLPGGCSCPERFSDLMIYGTHACIDGRRIHPADLYLPPTLWQRIRAIARRIGRPLKRLGLVGCAFFAGCAYTGLVLGVGHGLIERIWALGVGQVAGMGV